MQAIRARALPIPMRNTSSPKTDRLNQIIDPQITAISRDFDAILDPRPMAGSPALSNALLALPAGDDFFMNVDFQGAFGTWNWLSGWTAMASGG